MSGDPILSSLRAALRGSATAAGPGSPAKPAVALPPMPGPNAPTIDQARAVVQRATALLDYAVSGRDLKAMTSALKEAREALKLLGQFTGDLASGQAVQVIFEHPAARDFVTRAMGHVQAILAERLGDDAVREAMAELARRIEAERSAAGQAAPPAPKGVAGSGRMLGA